MAAVAPSNFLRLKYRPPPVHPELNEEEAEYDKSHSIAKKTRVEEEDELAELRALRFRPAIMFPGNTQNKRVEAEIVSDDVAYRKEVKPTLFERVELQKALVKKQLREEQNEARKLEQKEQLRQRLAQLVSGSASLSPEEMERVRKDEEAKNRASKSADDGEEGKQESGDGTEGAGLGADELALSSLNENDFALMDPDEIAEVKSTLLELKEKRLLRTRQPWMYHTPVSTFQRRKLALKLALNVGKRGREMTEILPWLLLGKVEPARNMYGLAKLGVTHILNVTDDEPNLFPMQFVYLKLAVRDEDDANIGELIPQALELFKRVESKRGKVYVHCSAGVSRAPTMVIAYLVADRQISLRDAWTYVVNRRPTLQINSHFMFQLAELELAQGKGSSVTNHKEWMFYEFNRLRADIAETRHHNGLLSTSLELYRKREDEATLF